MNIHIDPHGHRLHLQQLEEKILQRNYDHSKPPLTGWRAEKKAAEFAGSDSKPVEGDVSDSHRWHIARSVAQIFRIWLGLRSTG